MSWLHKEHLEYLEGDDSSSPPDPQVLFEDNHLFIVYKPCRWLTEGDKTGDLSLFEWSKAYLKKTHEKPGNVFLGIVHRLDRPARGLVIFAKTSKAASRLSELFREHAIKKIYRLEVEGILEGSATLTHYIEEGKDRMVALKASDKGKKAELSYKVLEQRKKTTLLEVQLKTGRKHQIRSQMSAIGHPIVGDKRYGSKEPYSFGSIKLLSFETEFKHPTKSEQVSLSVPKPLLSWAQSE